MIESNGNFLEQTLKVWPLSPKVTPLDNKILEIFQSLQNLVIIGRVFALVYDHVNRRVPFVSNFAPDITGYSPRTYKKGISFLEDIMNPQDRPRIISQLKEVGEILHRLKPEDRSKYTFSMDYRLRKKDGKYIHVILEWLVLCNDPKGLIHCSFILLKEVLPSDPRISNRLLINPALPWDVEKDPDLAKLKMKLSEREKDMLVLLSYGHKTNEISQKLHLSPHTVNTHRKRLLKRFGQKNTASLVLFARENNLI
jgi:DNA-binding CsgD family transcriptional regulator